MSIKDDVNYVKTELSGDEKVLESVFKLETFYKKNKLSIWGLVAAILFYFVITMGMDAVRQSRLEAANQAFLTLQQKPDDKAALALLKEKNPALYELYTFSKEAKAQDVKALAPIEKSKDEILVDMSRYTVAAIEKKPVDSKLYKELAILESAYLDIKAGKVQNAKERLSLIDARSPLAAFAKLLEHATLKAE